MKQKVLLSLIFAWAFFTPLGSKEKTITIAEIEKIATEAYIYGYPLITMDMTKKVMTNVLKPSGMRAPIGQFANSRTYPDPSFTDVTTPNADTLYSLAFIDLSKEPYVLHLPNEKGRYYLMPMISGWSEVFAAPGTRTTGTETADFAITGPGWIGVLPEGLKEIKSPTNMVWIVGRTYCSGTEKDFEEVYAIQDQYSLTPLSSFGKPYAPPDNVLNHNIDMKTPIKDQVDQLDAVTFFKRLAMLLVDNPPVGIRDDAILIKMEKMGFFPGQEYDPEELDPKISIGISKAPELGQKKIMSLEKTYEKKVNGWMMSLKTGIYGSDYLTRAFVASMGFGSNRSEDALYPYTRVDSKGDPLNGKNNYMIHFVKGQTPPAKGFWSLSMYNDHYFFVKNTLDRYSISPRNRLKYNEDGSLDLYIQNSYPGKEKESNWLPAPSGDFILMLRLYWPEESVLKGSWAPPPVQKRAQID